MKNPCPVCNENPVVYSGATTCSYHCWLIHVGAERDMGEQQNLFGEQEQMSTETAARKKPRITGKVKREALREITSLIMFKTVNDENYTTSEELLKLTESLKFDLDKKG